MRVVISEAHLKVNRSLIKESNRLAGNFSANDYSKTEDIEKLLARRDISVENKKKALANKSKAELQSAEAAYTQALEEASNMLGS